MATSLMEWRSCMCLDSLQLNEMRVSERELAYVSSLKSDREGRLNYRNVSSFRGREGYKERWFKLRGNLLFYFRLNEYGAVYGSEPNGVFVIENCRVQLENDAEMPFSFSIVFLDDEGKKHMFSGPTLQHCEQWVKSLSEASYEHLREKMIILKRKIEQKEAQLQEPSRLYHRGLQLESEANSSQDTNLITF